MLGIYRDKPQAKQEDPAEDEGAPRLVWEGPLYPDEERRERVRIVRVREAERGATKLANNVEVLLRWSSLGEPCWTPIEGAQAWDVIRALANVFR